MSDEQRLLAILIVIYLADCLWWIPRHGLGLSRWVGAFWHLRWPSRSLGNDRGGVSLANPLPPLGLVSRIQGWPISLSPEGVFSYVSAGFAGSRPPQVAASFDWDAIRAVAREGKEVRVNGALFCKTTSGRTARRLAEAIARLARLPAAQRTPEIKSLLASSFDEKSVRARVADFYASSRMLGLTGNLLFLFLFGVCPLLVWRFGLAVYLWPILAVLLAQTITIAFLFRHAHRKLYPNDASEILTPFLTMLLAPPSAIRARDLLGRTLLEEFHPLCAAHALCSARDFETLAPVVVRDMRYPLLPVFPAGSPESARRIEEWFRTELLQLAARLSPATPPPVRSDPTHQRYCPRCWQQFTAEATVCPDCGGRPLELLPQ